MKRDWTFSDVDETLFTSDSLIGLQRTFLDYSVTLTIEGSQDYQVVNKPLWVNYQNGATTSLQLQHGRLESWAERLEVEAGLLNDAFISAMAEICAPLPGTASLLNVIRGNAKIGIITNDFSALQQVRLERTGLRDYFDLLAIFEEVGVVRPNRKIFDYVLEQAGNPDRSRVLMVGDTAEFDILGGIDTGLVTHWSNAHHREQPEGIVPTWTASPLHELERLLCKH